MSEPRPSAPLLTLEPLLDAVQRALVRSGWVLTGLQKTTSWEFEGHWSEATSRSAYAFFDGAGPDHASLEVFLDETDRGLQGTVGLVVEGPPAGSLPAAATTMARLQVVANRFLPDGYPTPLSLSIRLPERDASPEDAVAQFRFKLRIPGRAIEAGAAVVESVVVATVEAFGRLLADPGLLEFGPSGAGAP